VFTVTTLAFFLFAELSISFAFLFWVIFVKKCYGVTFTSFFELDYLRNGKRAACNHRVIYARGRLLSTKEAQESHKAIAECNSSLSA